MRGDPLAQHGHRRLRRRWRRHRRATCASRGVEHRAGAAVSAIAPARRRPGRLARRGDAITRAGSSTAPGSTPTASPDGRAPSPSVQIVPFRGEYYMLRPEARAPGARADLSGARSRVPVPRRALHADDPRRASKPDPTRCWPSRARATAADACDPSECSATRSPTAASGRWRASTGAPAPYEVYRSLQQGGLRQGAAAARARAQAPRTWSRAAPACARRPSARRRAGRRLQHRRQSRRDPRAERAVAGGDRLAGHRTPHRRAGRGNLRLAVTPDGRPEAISAFEVDQITLY